jgi:hypothetical protein
MPKKASRTVTKSKPASKSKPKPKAAAKPKPKATSKAGRGVTTAEERTFAALLERRLRQLGLARARVTAVATKAGQGADLLFEHIPASAIDALRKAIGS